jgi:hypothetical protein
MLVLCPVAGKLFELRADWFALLALLGAMAILSERLDVRGVLLAGVLAGIATCFTQKSIPLWLGMAAWTAIVRPLATFGLLAGVLVAPSALFAVFWSLGAARSLVDSVLVINLAWPPEVGFEASWYPSAVAALAALAAVGLALRAIASAVGNLVRSADVPRERTLVAIVAAFGIGAYVTSPVPWEQSFLMLVVPWVGWLAVDALGDYSGGPRRWIADRRALALATILAVAAAAIALACGRTTSGNGIDAQSSRSSSRGWRSSRWSARGRWRPRAARRRCSSRAPSPPPRERAPVS